MDFLHFGQNEHYTSHTNSFLYNSFNVLNFIKIININNNNIVYFCPLSLIHFWEISFCTEARGIWLVWLLPIPMILTTTRWLQGSLIRAMVQGEWGSADKPCRIQLASTHMSMCLLTPTCFPHLQQSSGKARQHTLAKEKNPEGTVSRHYTHMCWRSRSWV